MKIRLAGPLLSISLATIIFLPIAIPALAQSDTSAAMPEPEYTDHFYAFGTDGKIVSLENAQPRSENKSSTIVIRTKVKRALVVPGAASSVRLPPSAHLAVKADLHGQDPSSLIKLVQMTVSKDQRMLPEGGATGSVLGAHTNAADVTYIPFTVKKYGQMSFEIIPSSPLPPGEYAIYGYGRETVELDCFGVDAK